MANLKRVMDHAGEQPLVVKIPRTPGFLDASDPCSPEVIKGRISPGSAAVISWIKDYGGRCVLYLLPDHRQVRVNGQTPHACCLEEGDRLRVGAVPYVFLERLPLEVMVAKETLEVRCVYCHGEILPQEKFINCPNCHAAHHMEHWFDFNGGMCGDCRYAAVLEQGEREDASDG